MPLVLAGAIAVSGYQAIDLNYVRYDDQTEAYVYVHTTRDMFALIDEIEATAERAGTGKQTGIVFVTPEYWPLPWYFRDYPRGRLLRPDRRHPGGDDRRQRRTRRPSSRRRSPGKYDRVGQYNLRPGVDLALYVRTDIPKG